MIRLRLLLLGISLTALVPTSQSSAADPSAKDVWLDSHIDGLITLYRQLHTHPELSFKEVETSKKIAEELRKAGCEVTTAVGGMGVVGVLKNGAGATVLVRTDLDALPVTEATGLPYASKAQTIDDEGKHVGVMHACGHDIHMTNLIGTALWLSAHKDRWSGTVVFIGQPAEERIGGAKLMLDDGLYERFPKPNYALALHVAHDLETGKVGYRAGPAMASSTSMDIIVKGKGGHGAMPQNTVDPIVLSAALVLELQSIVSREIKPFDPAVITVGSIHGGTKHNIIPSEVHLQLTLRAFKDEVRDQLIEAIKRRAKGLAEAHRAPAPTVEISDGTPPTINTPSLVDKVVPMLAKELGSSQVEECEPTMGAEDFGLFDKGGVPIFMFRLGTIPPDRLAASKAKGETLPSLHSPFYYPDPAPSLRTGVRAMTAAVVGLLPPKNSSAGR
jgi:hippurate hydrolase